MLELLQYIIIISKKIINNKYICILLLVIKYVLTSKQKSTLKLKKTSITNICKISFLWRKEY